MGLLLPMTRAGRDRLEARSGPIGASHYPSTTVEQMAAMLAAVDGGGLPPLTVDRALKAAAAWSCIDVLCTTASSLPVDVVRRAGDARLPVATPGIIERPSPLVSRRVWLYQLMFSLTTDGNAFGWVGNNVDSLGHPTRIDLLAPSTVTARGTTAEGIGEVQVNGRGRQLLWPHGPVWHVPGKVVPAGSPFALSPLEAARVAVGAGLEAEGYGARFFTEGGHPSAILSADSEIGEELAQRIKAAFVAAIRPGSREPAVMGAGLKYERVQSDPNTTGYLELARFAVEQACRIWRVPPSMVYGAISGQSVTYANASQADLHYLKHSIDGYLQGLEEQLSELLARPRSVVVRREALLRADPAERYKTHETALKNRIRSVNEVRALEDLPPWPHPDFDLPGVPPWAGTTEPPAPPAGADGDDPQEGDE
jgi:HK97 family phage portal protein